MKKVSTAAAKQSRNISHSTLTIGLDLGDRNSWYCVLDEAGQIQLEQPVRTTAKALQEVFGAMPRSRIALEIGTHSPWISRLLSELGHEVIVANARKVRLIGESHKKDDRMDAQTLARLARIDPQLLYPVKHRSAQAQAELMMIRARAGLVRARTGLVNTARGLAKSYGERLRSCNVGNMDAEKAEGLSPELQRALEPLLAAIAEVSERISEYNDRIEALAQASYPQVELLKQIKGVGTLIAFTKLARARTRPARAPIIIRSACAGALRCFTGYSNSGSILASRANVCASSRSSFLRLSPINRTFRALATITSCPNALSKRLIQGECVPISSATRLRGMAPKTSCNPFAVVRTRCSSCIRPASSSTQYHELRSPRSSPMVSFCREIFLLCFATAVLTFFIAGLLFSVP